MKPSESLVTQAQKKLSELHDSGTSFELPVQTLQPLCSFLLQSEFQVSNAHQAISVFSCLYRPAEVLTSFNS